MPTSIRYNVQKLKRARLKLGWDQTKTAYLAKLSVASVNRMERGRTYKPATVKAVSDVIADALGIDRDVMMDSLLPNRDKEPTRDNKEMETVTAGE